MFVMCCALSLAVQRGIDKGHRITFEEAANQHPGFIPGDLVLVVVQIPHARFMRKAANLVYKHTVQYEEAACGVSFDLEHLDGRMITITTEPGQLVPPVTSHVIRCEGMPVYGTPHVKGDLYVIFSVVGAPSLPEDGSTHSLENKLSLAEFWRMLRET